MITEAALPSRTGEAAFFIFLGGADEVALAYGEAQLGKMARKLGGKWVADVKLWYIEYGRIKGTELEKHIVLDASKKNSGQ